MKTLQKLLSVQPMKCTNILGYGFLEKVYQKALQVELLRRGHSAEIEHPIKVEFKGAIVGEYESRRVWIVAEKVIVELKVAKEYNPKDEPQLLNELKATTIKVGYSSISEKRK